MQLITVDDLLVPNGISLGSVSPEYRGNMILLCDAVNGFLADCGISIDWIHVNDGLRIRGLQDYGSPNSQHYRGNAVDLDDIPGARLAKIFLMNLPLMKKHGLFMEDPRWTNGMNPRVKYEQSWVHLQRVPPQSGRRVFIPSATPPLDPSIWNGVYDRTQFDVFV